MSLEDELEKFKTLTQAKQKHVVKVLRLLEQDGVIKPPISPQFLKLLTPEKDKQ